MRSNEIPEKVREGGRRRSGGVEGGGAAERRPASLRARRVFNHLPHRAEEAKLKSASCNILNFQVVVQQNENVRAKPSAKCLSERGFGKKILGSVPNRTFLYARTVGNLPKR